MKTFNSCISKNGINKTNNRTRHINYTSVKKAFILVAGLLLHSITNLAQQKSTFLFRGKIDNAEKNYIEFSTTGYFSEYTGSVITDKKGNFSKEIYLDGTQDIRVRLKSNYLVFYAKPGDTINFYIDLQKPDASLKLSSHSPLTDKSLQLCLTISKQRQEAFVKMYRQLATAENMPDSLKFKQINQSYNSEMAIIAATANPSFDCSKVFYDNYFKHAKLLLNHNLLNKYNLITDSLYQIQKHKGFSYKDIFYKAFHLSDYYREFLFDYVCLYTPFRYINTDNSTEEITFNPTKSSYLFGEGSIPIPIIKDWYLTKVIMDGFEAYDYDDVKPLYDHFITSDAKKEYIDTLKTFYDKMSKLKPGMPAPPFTLKDINGKPVSLSDFKGKFIYIDFWGVYCGPCIGDIMENAQKVHLKYKNKNIEFVSICVDQSGDIWKNKVRDLGLDGVNLTYKDQLSGNIRSDYHISSIPHYMLINPEGKIVNYNMDDLWQLVSERENRLDRVISGK